MSGGRTGPPSRRGRSEDHPRRSSSPILTLRCFEDSIPPSLGPVAPVQVMCLDPFLGDDGRTEGQLAAENGGRDDLGELVDLAGAVAVEHLETLALGRE